MLTNNSTYLAGHPARSISYVSSVHPGGTYNFMVFSTHRDSIYQIAYGAPLSKYQEELSEVNLYYHHLGLKNRRFQQLHLQLKRT